VRFVLEPFHDDGRGRPVAGDARPDGLASPIRRRREGRVDDGLGPQADGAAFARAARPGLVTFVMVRAAGLVRSWDADPAACDARVRPFLQRGIEWRAVSLHGDGCDATTLIAGAICSG
jgi:hypothetical protein